MKFLEAREMMELCFAMLRADILQRNVGFLVYVPVGITTFAIRKLYGDKIIIILR